MNAHRQHPDMPKATPVADALYYLGTVLLAIVSGVILAWRG